MVLSDLNLLVISSFVPIASILPSLIAMATVALSKELFTVYIVASVIIESTVLSFFSNKKQEKIKQKITYRFHIAWFRWAKIKKEEHIKNYFYNLVFINVFLTLFFYLKAL
jgi:hypothetical protein